MAEPFPTLNSTSPDPSHHHTGSASGENGSIRQRRRKSTGLRGEPRGDTAAPAFATLNDRTPSTMGTETRSGALTGKRSEKSQRRSKRRKVRSIFQRWKSISFRHTWLNPLLLCLAVVGVYRLSPGPSNPLHPALFLSYPRGPKDDDPSATMYGKGKKDFAFVAFYTIFLSFTREFIMQRFLRPLALHYGIRKRAKQARFMEQLYTAIYFSVLGPFGMYVMSRTPVWYFSTPGMYAGFPHKELEGVFKAYYLIQASYWLQQMIVLLLMLEKPRKDFKELVAHHFITLSLIFLSYRFHFTYMGIAVYITHDISDFFLATSKTLNYLDSPVVVPYFVLFVGIWTYLRHYINLRIIFSFFPQFSSIGPYQVVWETGQYKFWVAQIITLSLLASLQAVNMFWLFLILRIAYRLVRGGEKKDDRSDDDEDEEEEEEETIAPHPVKREPEIHVIGMDKAPGHKATAMSLGVPVANGKLGNESDAGSASETGRTLRRSPRKRKV
ncbi:longevity assurance proteins LAG1/LAC1 [Eremomyces bilateralis CBS 781.70]|uniref:Longevity assurance proteins LAG1/LAC1 n=1 Tax=Eremomyces bilateralis CBS 781.70 TaxID=1392243 RepID=A0A6G1GBL6_9PEZI|nr:longevity assurance proteins LAG1/LAC1 [Eremomyces bilateralis CBS 781.70]KAF1815291.1 longevity assurance proteins LAG1/LAC1 [Eremomyces bilateralis CBS 781.70]